MGNPKRVKRSDISKRLHKLYDTATSQGWVVYRTNNQHLKWVPPEGEYVFSGSTPAVTAVQHIQTELRKKGLRT